MQTGVRGARAGGAPPRGQARVPSKEQLISLLPSGNRTEETRALRGPLQEDLRTLGADSHVLEEAQPVAAGRATPPAGRGRACPLTIRLTVQPTFLFSVSSPFMQSLEGERR